jgi:hypothetical protein
VSKPLFLGLGFEVGVETLAPLLKAGWHGGWGGLSHGDALHLKSLSVKGFDFILPFLPFKYR